MASLVLPILLFVGMYLLLIRPQQQKAKAQRALVQKAAAGDRVMLSNGIFGTLTEVLATSAYIEVAEGIEMLVSRSSIHEILERFPTDEADADDIDYDEIEELDDADEEAEA